MWYYTFLGIKYIKTQYIYPIRYNYLTEQATGIVRNGIGIKKALAFNKLRLYTVKD